MSKTDEFVNLIKSKLGCGYAYGGQGEILTKESLNRLIKTFGRDHYYGPDKNVEIWMGKQVFDCSGLIIWALQQMQVLKPTEDYTSHGIYQKLCVPIKMEELQPGDLCFVRGSPTANISHVGIFIGNNEVIHARGTKYGVVKTAILPYFGLFGRIKALDELKVALDFISSKSGIDVAYWYNKAKQVDWLELCFIKIAKGFGGLR